MAVEYRCDFNVADCIKDMGLEERGRIQQFMAQEVLRLCDPYLPLDMGGLKSSGHVESGTEVVWDTPYATYQWNGLVYEDPKLHCAGFETKNGWRSKKGVQKVPTDRSLEYQGAPMRGRKWADRMLQNGGRKKIEDAVRRKVKEG